MRAAVLRALLTFLNIQGDGTKGWVEGKILRLIFQNLLVERVEVRGLTLFISGLANFILVCFVIIITSLDGIDRGARSR